MSFSDCITRRCPTTKLISPAAFLSDLLSSSEILRDTTKQLQLKLLAYRTVQLQLEIISCSCNFNYRIL